MFLPQPFLEILACPKRTCRGDLVETIKDSQPFLSCELCHTDYPILHGIPVLFPNAAHDPELHQRHWDLAPNAQSYASKYNAYLKKQGTPWGLYTHTSEMRAVDKLVKKVKLDLRAKTVFDAGCGNGRLLSAYPEAKHKIGLDTSLNLLIDLKQRQPDFWLVCAQLEDMPFKDCIADFTVSIRVFQHIKAPELAFAEMVRLTRPSGYLSLELYNKLNLKEIYKRLRMWAPFDKLWPWGLDYDRYFSYREIESWCRHNFIKPLGYSGAGWGIHFYLFEPLKFRGLVPHPIQKPIYNFFLFLEDIIGTWPFFNKTLEKVTFIGTLQGPLSKTSFYRRLRNHLKRKKEMAAVDQFQAQLNHRNYAHTGTNEHHLRLTIDWLKLAQNATADSGLSRGFSLVKSSKSNPQGWQPSYPETTGYIIPTFIAASHTLKDPDLMRRACLMADWEMNILFPDGAVHGGNIAAPPNKALFDTGQVIRGLIAIYRQTHKEKYLSAALKSADWMLASEYDKQGYWIAHQADCVSAETTAYYTYAVAPLVELGKIAKRNDLVELGNRVAKHTLTLQEENGWFRDADFEPRDDYLLHTIAYTIDGLWDIGQFLDKKEFSTSSIKALDGVISAMDKLGKIPARLNKDWHSNLRWYCLTGIAQIGLTSLKVYQTTKDKKYLSAAKRAKEFLKTTQNNLDSDFGGLGAIYGSWPIRGQYGQYQALNWPAKFFADLLILTMQLEHVKN